MNNIWNPQSNEVLKSWVEAIIDEASDDLNDWETKFIHDIQIKVANNWSLTQKQEETLERIYADKTK